MIFKKEDDDDRERVTEEEERVSIAYDVSQQRSNFGGSQVEQ